MTSRRRLLALSLAALSGRASADQRRSMTDPLRVGADFALIESGLARDVQRGFGLDTRLALKLVPGPALPLLEGLERGELDLTLTNTPDAEARLAEQGLAHDQHLIAAGGFLIVGPLARARGKDPAAIQGLQDAAEALVRLRLAALARPGTIEFLSAGDGSGTHVREQALWRQARLAPAAPWYVSADRGTGLVAEARARNAYAVVERGAWAVGGGAPLSVLVEGGAALIESVQALRSFRVDHPAARIFVAWLTGAKGRRVIAAQRAYQVA